MTRGLAENHGTEHTMSNDGSVAKDSTTRGLAENQRTSFAEVSTTRGLAENQRTSQTVSNNHPHTGTSI